MKIAVVGVGPLGRTIGCLWRTAGHDVTWGVRLPRPVERTGADPDGCVPLAKVREGADVVLLAVPWPAVPSVLNELGDLRGVTLLDCTNPVTSDLQGLDHPDGFSGAEQIARLAPHARVVKIFNTVSAERLTNTMVGSERLVVLYATDHRHAALTAARLARDIGLDPVSAGRLRAARLLEAMGLLWLHLAKLQRLGRDLAFHLVGRKPCS